MRYKKFDLVTIINTGTKATVLDYEMITVAAGYTGECIYHVEAEDGFSVWLGEQYIRPYKEAIRQQLVDCDCGAKFVQDSQHQHSAWCASKQIKMEAKNESINNDICIVTDMYYKHGGVWQTEIIGIKDLYKNIHWNKLPTKASE